MRRAIAAADRRTIGLTMIVRNAESTIEATLTSAMPLIDSWTIVDTGSTDGTIDVIRRVLRDVPGALHQQPWQDFGTNRSYALGLASASADYLLLLDADETISGTVPDPLWMDGYDLHVLDAERWEPRLVRADLSWRFVGVAQDRLSCARPVARLRTESAHVRHHQDVDARHRALQRDEQLLVQAVDRDPADLLALFDLGVVELAAGKVELARARFERCAQDGGWDELQFASALALARIAARTDPEAGMRLLLEIWESRPNRAEPLYDFALLAQAHQRAPRALLATSAGIKLSEPPEGLLVQPWVYRWRMPLLHVEALRSIDRFDEATTLIKELLDDPSLPARLLPDAVAAHQRVVEARAAATGTRVTAEAVSISDVLALPLLTELCGTVATAEVAGPSEGRPSVIAASVATSVHEFALLLAIQDTAGRTSRTLHVYDRLGAPVTTVPIPEYPAVDSDQTSLFWWRDAWYGLVHGVGSVSLITLHPAVGTPAVAIESDRDSRDEPQRLMPVVDGHRLLVVTRLDPIEVSVWNDADRRLEAVSAGAAGVPGWVGGTPGLSLTEGFLFVLRRERHGEHRDLMTHRFLLVDRELRPAGISAEFVFQGYGDEVCQGIAQRGADIVCSYTTGQHRGYLSAVSTQRVIASLQPIDAPAGQDRRRSLR